MSEESQVPPVPAGRPEGGAGAGEEKKGRRRFRPWRRRRGGDREVRAEEPATTASAAESGEKAEARDARADRGRPRGEAPREGRSGGRGGREREGREAREGGGAREGREAREGRDSREREPRRGGDRRDPRSGGRGGDEGARVGNRNNRFGRPRPEGPGAGGGSGTAPRTQGGPREILRAVLPRGVVTAPPPPTLRVVIAGGGTGGHIYPALAVADEIRRRNRESRILFIGTEKGLEARLVPESGYDIEYLKLSGFAGRGPLARVVALVQLARGVFRMRDVIRRFDPELVLGTGGYVSGPAVLAGHWAKVPTMIQEQNSIPGKMNRFLARFVNEVHVAYTESRMHFKETEKIRLSGNPARIRQPRGSQVTLYRKLDLDPERQTVLVLGGSRGARSLNRAIAETLPLFSGRSDVQFVIQTGQEDLALVEGAAANARVKAVVRPFFSPIEEVYAVATMVVCRAGAMTLAEIAQFGLPAILVPFPFAIYQHQLSNARILEDKGAAEVVLDRELSGKLLSGKIEALLADRARRREMGLNAWNLARPDAHERVVNAIESLTHPVEKKGAVDLVMAEALEAGEGSVV